MRSKKEILSSQEYLTVNDIKTIMNVSTNVAERIINEIKVKSGNIGTKGKVTIGEYELWRNGGRNLVVFRGNSDEKVLDILKVFSGQFGADLPIGNMVLMLEGKR